MTWTGWIIHVVILLVDFWCSHEPPKKLNFCSLCGSGLAALTVQRMLILVSSEQQWFCGILFMMGKFNLGRSHRNENYQKQLFLCVGCQRCVESWEMLPLFTHQVRPAKCYLLSSLETQLIDFVWVFSSLYFTHPAIQTHRIMFQKQAVGGHSKAAEVCTIMAKMEL